MTKSLRLGIGIGSALVLGYAGLMWWKAGEPVRVAYEVRQHMIDRQWDSLFDLAVTEEKEKNAWTRAQFKIFADDMTRHVANVDLGDKIVEFAVPVNTVPGTVLWDTANERRFHWKVPVPMKVADLPTSDLAITVVKDTDGQWHAMVGNFLRDVNHCNRTDKLAHIKSLRDALTDAKLPCYYNLIGDQVLTVASLNQVLKGEIQGQEAWERVNYR